MRERTTYHIEIGKNTFDLLATAVCTASDVKDENGDVKRLNMDEIIYNALRIYCTVLAGEDRMLIIFEKRHTDDLKKMMKAVRNLWRTSSVGEELLTLIESCERGEHLDNFEPQEKA